MRDILLVVGVFACAIVAIRKPVFGILTFVCVSLLNPHSLTWGYGRTFPFALPIAIGTLIGFLVSAGRRRFPINREFLLLITLWGIYGFTTMFAFDRSEASLRLFNISKILLMVIFSTALISTEQDLFLLMKVIALSLGFHGLKAGIFVLASGGNYMVWGPEGSFLAANNAIGLALAMNIPFLFHLARMEKNKWLRWLMQSMFWLSYPATICTFSRGAWLGLAAVTLLIIWRSKHRVAVLTAAVIIITFVLPFLPERVHQRYDDLENYQEEASAQSRFWNWEFCTRVGLSNPITGAGFNYYSFDAYQKFFPEFLSRWPGKVWSCHSMWFTILGEHGLPGFIIWNSLILCSFITIRKIRSFGKARQQGQWVEFADMITGAMIGYIVSGTFLDVAYFDLFYQLIAAVIIAESLNRISLNDNMVESNDSVAKELLDSAISSRVLAPDMR